MSNLLKLFKNQGRLMAPYGVPDLAHQLSNQPSLTDYKASLSATTYKAMQLCCNVASSRIKPCHNPVCPRCSLVQRIELVKKICDVQFQHRLCAAFVTYVPHALSVPQGRLSSYPLNEQVDVLLSAFQRAWSDCRTTIALVGSPDISLNEDAENLNAALSAAERKKRHHFQIHYHFVILAERPMMLAESLKTVLLSGRAPSKGEFSAKPCHCTGRTLIYSTKIRPVRRAINQDRRGNDDRKIRPLARRPMSEALTWLFNSTSNRRIFTFFHAGEDL